MKKLNIKVVESTLPPKDESVIWLHKMPNNYKIEYTSVVQGVNGGLSYTTTETANFGKDEILIRKFIDGYWVLLGKCRDFKNDLYFDLLLEQKNLIEALDKAIAENNYTTFNPIELN